MHWTLVLIAALVAWSALGGLWRTSGLVLFVYWCAGQIYYYLTGIDLPIELYKRLDLIAGAIILARAGSKLDYAIFVGYIPCQWAYHYQQGAEQWWTLWFITCLQLFLAGPIPQIQRGLTAYSHGPRRAVT